MGFGMWLIPIVLIIIVIYFLTENSKGEAKTSLHKMYLTNVMRVVK